MRRYKIPFILFIAAFFSFQAHAQKDTSSCKEGEGCCIMKCMGGKDGSMTTFGGPSSTLTGTGVGNELAIGGGGGVLFDCGFFVGGFGQGSMDMAMDGSGPTETSISTGYGGLWVGGHPFADKTIHPKWGLKAGYGGVDATRPGLEGRPDQTLLEEDVFVLEPDIGVGVKVCNSMMLDISAGYRYMSGLDGNEDVDLSSADMNGFQGKFSVLFGSF